MEINAHTLLLDLNRRPLTHPESGEPWSVGLVLSTVALGAPPKDVVYTEAEHKVRYKIAVDIRDAMEQDPETAMINLTPEMIVMLKADIMRSFGPIVGGQIAPILNGETTRLN